MENNETSISQTGSKSTVAPGYIKACPFCGELPHLIAAPDPDKFYDVLYGVQCHECGQADSGFWPEKKTAFDAWNKRNEQWVSVDKRLPENNDHCLVFENHEIYLGWYDVGEKSFYMVRYGNDDNIRLNRATFWKPLPVAPDTDRRI